MWWACGPDVDLYVSLLVSLADDHCMGFSTALLYDVGHEEIEARDMSLHETHMKLEAHCQIKMTSKRPKIWWQEIIGEVFASGTGGAVERTRRLVVSLGPDIR